MKDRLRKVQFKYLDYLFENTYGVKSKFYPDSTFFKKDDKVILELEKSGTLWVLYSVWGSISDTFSLQYEETQQLIKEWMECQLKSGVVVPEGLLDGGFTQVEKQLRLLEIEPDCNFNTNIIRVQEELKSEEVTPYIKGHSGSHWVESRLKLKEITPQRMNYVILGGAGEELEEVTPKEALPPYSWTNLKSEEIKPTISTSYRLEEKLKSEEITQQI
jgi:hypothetical protein